MDSIGDSRKKRKKSDHKSSKSSRKKSGSVSSGSMSSGSMSDKTGRSTYDPNVTASDVCKLIDSMNSFFEDLGDPTMDSKGKHSKSDEFADMSPNDSDLAANDFGGLASKLLDALGDGQASTNTNADHEADKSDQFGEDFLGQLGQATNVANMLDQKDFLDQLVNAMSEQASGSGNGMVNVVKTNSDDQFGNSVNNSQFTNDQQEGSARSAHFNSDQYNEQEGSKRSVKVSNRSHSNRSIKVSNYSGSIKVSNRQGGRNQGEGSRTNHGEGSNQSGSRDNSRENRDGSRDNRDGSRDRESSREQSQDGTIYSRNLTPRINNSRGTHPQVTNAATPSNEDSLNDCKRLEKGVSNERSKRLVINVSNSASNSRRETPRGKVNTNSSMITVNNSRGGSRADSRGQTPREANTSRENTPAAGTPGSNLEPTPQSVRIEIPNATDTNVTEEFSFLGDTGKVLLNLLNSQDAIIDGDSSSMNPAEHGVSAISTTNQTRDDQNSPSTPMGGGNSTMIKVTKAKKPDGELQRGQLIGGPGPSNSGFNNANNNRMNRQTPNIGDEKEQSTKDYESIFFWNNRTVANLDRLEYSIEQKWGDISVKIDMVPAGYSILQQHLFSKQALVKAKARWLKKRPARMEEKQERMVARQEREKVIKRFDKKLQKRRNDAQKDGGVRDPKINENFDVLNPKGNEPLFLHWKSSQSAASEDRQLLASNHSFAAEKEARAIHQAQLKEYYNGGQVNQNGGDDEYDPAAEPVMIDRELDDDDLEEHDEYDPNAPPSPIGSTQNDANGLLSPNGQYDPTAPPMASSSAPFSIKQNVNGTVGLEQNAPGQQQRRSRKQEVEDDFEKQLAAWKQSPQAGMKASEDELETIKFMLSAAPHKMMTPTSASLVKDHNSASSASGSIQPGGLILGPPPPRKGESKGEKKGKGAKGGKNSPVTKHGIGSHNKYTAVTGITDLNITDVANNASGIADALLHQGAKFRITGGLQGALKLTNPAPPESSAVASSAYVGSSGSFGSSATASSAVTSPFRSVDDYDVKLGVSKQADELAAALGMNISPALNPKSTPNPRPSGGANQGSDGLAMHTGSSTSTGVSKPGDLVSIT